VPLDTAIQWCDSTVNLEMGCDGCELWNPAAGVRACYAGVLTEKWGGRRGWPESFDKPALFPERLDKALRWPDLTSTDRPDKPWLDGRPRVVFLNDMGDTFTESLPLDWLAPLLPRLADSPHVWMVLTKRGHRLRQFSERHPLPANVWPGVSVTGPATLPRVRDLLAVRGGGDRWVSAEPLRGAVDLAQHLAGLGLVIVGGESRQRGSEPVPCRLSWVRSLLRQCRAAGVPAFVKQLGGHVLDDGKGDRDPERLRLRDRDHGGAWDEWPADLRAREFPAAEG
jgi:protein gp37